MPKKVVIDSSVALKWWLDDEEFIDKARSLLDDIVDEKIEIVVPELWFYEIANGINTAAKRERISNDMALDFLEELQSLNPTIVSVVPLISKAYKEAVKYTCAIYDIVYMIIAESESISLITADERFFDRVKNDKTFVTHLSKYHKIV